MKAQPFVNSEISEAEFITLLEVRMKFHNPYPTAKFGFDFVSLMDRLSRQYGFVDWLQAYHKLVN